jgi:hypothetical protein
MDGNKVTTLMRVRWHAAVNSDEFLSENKSANSELLGESFPSPVLERAFEYL